MVEQEFSASLFIPLIDINYGIASYPSNNFKAATVGKSSNVFDSEFKDNAYVLLPSCTYGQRRQKPL